MNLDRDYFPQPRHAVTPPPDAETMVEAVERINDRPAADCKVAA